MESKPKVGLFATCLIDLMRPDIGFSVVKLLEQAGCEVVVPETQTCCGQPGYNSGERKSARELAEKFIIEFERFDYVVVPSGSCAGMIKVHYADALRDDKHFLGRMDALGRRVHELTDFLCNVLLVEDFKSKFTGRITYHDSCSGLRELGIKAQPRDLLEGVPGVTVTEMRDCQACCGFGGTFAVKYGAISGAIVDEKIRSIQATGADAVVMGDLGCMLNIEGRMRRQGDLRTRVLHIAQILAGDA